MCQLCGYQFSVKSILNSSTVKPIEYFSSSKLAIYFIDIIFIGVKFQASKKKLFVPLTAILLFSFVRRRTLKGIDERKKDKELGRTVLVARFWLAEQLQLKNK